MLQSIIFFIAGCLVTWLVSHYYHKKNTQALNKLPSEILEKIKIDPRNKLTIKELNDLIDFRTRDLTKKGLDSYIACPKCGSKLIKDKELIDYDIDGEPDGSISYFPITADILKCKRCGWKISEYDIDGENNSENIYKS